MITVKMKDGFEIEVNPTFVKDSEQLEELANKDQLSGLFYSCNCLPVSYTHLTLPTTPYV